MDWKPNYFRLFISHVSANHQFAEELSTDLRAKFGIDGFVAHADIEPSADWQNEIEDALNSMHALLALLSNGFSQSVWCNQEVGWALGREQLAISIRDGEDPPGFTGRFQAVRIGDRNTTRISSDIFELLSKNPQTAEQISRTTCLQFLHASSWEYIRHVSAPCLEMLTVFPDDALDNLERAFTDNSRVSDSFYVEGARQILRKNGRDVPTS